MHRLFAIFALGTIVSTPGTRAWAAEPAPVSEASGTAPSGEAEARRLFFLGRDAWKAGDFAQACRHFRASQELSSSPATLLNLGKCQEREGDRKSARESYERALREARAHPDPERGNLWAAVATRELDALPAEVAPEPVPVATTESPAARSPVLAPGQGAMPVPPRGRDDRADGEQSSPNPLPWVLVGGGALLVGGAVVTGIVSANAKSELDRECTLPGSSPGHVGCPPHLSVDRKRARDFALVTDILWISGVATAAVGVTLWLTGSGSASEPKSAARLGCHTHGCDASVRAEF